MADYISCVEASGGNRQTMYDEVSKAAAAQTSGGLKASGGTPVAKGAGALVLSRDSEQALAKKFEQTWFSNAMAECTKVLSLPASKGNGEKGGSENKPKASSITIDQWLVSKSTSGRAIEVMVNNPTESDVVLTKFIYSRGVSSQEMAAIQICCLYCMEAWYAVQRGPVTTATPGTRVTDSVWFVNMEATERAYRGSVHMAPGCHASLFAQLDMNIAVVVPAKKIMKLGVVWPDEAHSNASAADKLPGESEPNLLASKDEICVFLKTKARVPPLKLCKPDAGRDDRFL
jgi:hypothetical protein